MVVLVLATMAIPVHAQSQPDGLSFQVDWNHLTPTANTKVGSTFGFSEKVRVTPTSLRDDYGRNDVPIVVRPGTDQPFSFSGGYHRGNKGVMFSTSSVSVSGSTSGRVSTDPFTMTIPLPSSSSPSVTASGTINGVCMFDHCLIPLQDDGNDSGFAPVNYHASSSLKVRLTKVMGTARLVTRPNFRLDGMVGGAVGRVENTRIDGLDMKAFVQTPPEFLPQVSDPHRWDYPALLSFDNNVSLEATGTISMPWLYGSVVGLGGEWSFDKLPKLTFQFAVTETTMTGKATEKMWWVDTDDAHAHILTSAVAPVEVDAIHLQGIFTSTLEERVFVPVLDAHVGVAYQIKPNIKVVGGFTGSYWTNLHLAPSWSVPGEWVGVAGTGTKQNAGSPAFSGARISVQLMLPNRK